MLLMEVADVSIDVESMERMVSMESIASVIHVVNEAISEAHS
jgi:hypothetical protein